MSLRDTIAQAIQAAPKWVQVEDGEALAVADAVVALVEAREAEAYKRGRVDEAVDLVEAERKLRERLARDILALPNSRDMSIRGSDGYEQALGDVLRVVRGGGAA